MAATGAEKQQAAFRQEEAMRTMAARSALFAAKHLNGHVHVTDTIILVQDMATHAITALRNHDDGDDPLMIAHADRLQAFLDSGI